MPVQAFLLRCMQLENILLDGNRILLGDWGSAQTYMTGIPSAAFESMQGYDAPEVLARKSHFLPHTDCWSLGVTLYTLACGKLPFDRTSPSYAQSVMSGSYPMPAHISTRLRSLICGLLSVDHVTRLTIFGADKPFFAFAHSIPTDIQHHEFFTSAKLPLMFPPMPDVALRRREQHEGVTGALVIPRPSSASSLSSDASRRRATVVTTTNNNNNNKATLRESPPRSTSFIQPLRIPREPPSPIHSEVSSLCCSPRCSSDYDAARAPSPDLVTTSVLPEQQLQKADSSATIGSSSSSPRPAVDQPQERKKDNKPLARALKFIKHLPARMLSSPTNPA